MLRRDITSVYKFIPRYTQCKVNWQSRRRNRTVGWYSISCKKANEYQNPDQYNPRSHARNCNAKGKCATDLAFSKIWLNGNDILLARNWVYGEERSQHWQCLWPSGSKGSSLGWLVVISCDFQMVCSALQRQFRASNSQLVSHLRNYVPCTPWWSNLLTVCIGRGKDQM